MELSACPENCFCVTAVTVRNSCYVPSGQQNLIMGPFLGDHFWETKFSVTGMCTKQEIVNGPLFTIIF